MKMSQTSTRRRLIRQGILRGDRRWLIVGLFAFMLSLSVAGPAHAADPIPSDLDTTFNGSGKVVTPVTSSGNNSDDRARAVGIQPDGKIVAAGYHTVRGAGLTFDFAVVRYNPNGSLDTSFGNGGIVSTGSVPNARDVASAIAFQPDGKILVAGQSEDTPSTARALVVRYNRDGTMDLGFGAGGMATASLTGINPGSIRGMALQRDGKILVAGKINYDFAVLRFTVDGVLDTTFGGGDGSVTTDFGGTDEALGVAIQTDGKILTGGRGGSGASGFAVARYSGEGIPDPGYGTAGKATTLPVGTSSVSGWFVTGFVLQPDGKAVLTGWNAARGSTPARDVLVRYATNGTLDATLGGTGAVITANRVATHRAEAVAVQGNKIVTVGQGEGPAPTTATSITIAAHNLVDGSVVNDNTFGQGGLVVLRVIDGSQSQGAYAVAFQADGRIVVGGYTDNPLPNTGYDSYDFAAARLIGFGPVPCVAPRRAVSAGPSGEGPTSFREVSPTAVVAVGMLDGGLVGLLAFAAAAVPGRRRRRPALSMVGRIASLRRRTAFQSGFTLVELLVVIVILGILAAVVVFAIRGAGDKGETNARATDRRTIQTAEEAYCAKAGHYATMDQLIGAAKANDNVNTYKFLSEASKYSSVTADRPLPPEQPGPCNGWRYTITPIQSPATGTGTDPCP
ncbi:MAG: prepilin-type N-terminal cleavage/methylation domain-containing protein [Acidimicrobiales bacterium]